MEFGLLWAALTAAALGWAGLHIWRERLPENAADTLLTAAIAGLAFGRLVAMLAQGTNPLTRPADFIVIRGGVSTPAAAFAFIAVLVWAQRKDLRGIDAIAPAVLLGLGGWHAGCLWRGACLGTPTELFWGWSQPGSAVDRHPVEIYAAIGLAIGSFLVGRLGWRPLTRAGTALAIASGVRLMTEPMRPSLTGGPIGWYWLAVALGVILVAAGPTLVRGRPAEPT